MPLALLEGEAPTRPAAPPVADATGAAALVVPPQEEIEILHQLALAGNMRKLGQRAAYLAALDARYGPFADRLRRLTKEYQSQAILDLVEKYLERKVT